MENIIEYASLAWDGFLLYALSFILVLSVLVFVHEWGHYSVAKLCGVKITAFSIGFGKELFSIHDKSGTKWRIAALPLGGYVQMFGDADASSSKKDETVKKLTEEEKKVAFYHKPLWQRAAIVFAGPGINFLFAILLFAGLYLTVGQPVTPPVVSGVFVDSAAYNAGIKPHDKVLSVNGRDVTKFSDIQREIMVALDTETTITVERDGRILTFNDIYPEKQTIEDRFGFKQSRGVLGVIGPDNAFDLSRVTSVDGRNVDTVDGANSLISRKLDNELIIGFGKSSNENLSKILIRPLASMNVKNDRNTLVLSNLDEGDAFVKHNPVSAVTTAVSETYTVIASTLKALGQMFTGTRAVDELGGVVRIGAIAGDALSAGWIPLITFTAFLSINLGLINLFPIPVLDGGHLLFYAIEAVKGSPVSENIQEYAYRFGFFLLIGLMLFANFNDLIQLVT